MPRRREFGEINIAAPMLVYMIIELVKDRYQVTLSGEPTDETYVLVTYSKLDNGQAKLIEAYIDGIISYYDSQVMV